jgi:protein tyrosine/serine phosphatase
MRRIVRIILGLFIATLIVGGPPLYHLYTVRTYRNFRVVKPGVLYRSGQLRLAGLEQLIREHGIRTVVTLRDADVPGERPPDWAEEEYCRKEELYYYRLSPKTWWRTDGRAAADENVEQFLRIIDDPKHYPILVHCFAGSHRTGAYCAIYRMEVEHMSNAEAMAELHAGGYTHLFEEEDIRGYLESYTPRWRRVAGK